MDDINQISITDQEYNNPWLVESGVKLTLPDSELQKFAGFVYIIECLSPAAYGKKYIGQKGLWAIKKLPKNKSRKRTKRVRISSDWKEYYGSSAELKNDIEKFGVECFSRKILYLCSSKGDMNYLEMREQIVRDALIRDDFYNSFIGGKIHRKHITKSVHLLNRS